MMSAPIDETVAFPHFKIIEFLAVAGDYETIAFPYFKTIEFPTVTRD